MNHEPTPHILIVGTAQPLSQSCRAACTQFGWQHSEHADPAKCARVPKGSFDLIVTDLEVPHIDGLELLRNLRAERPDTPILVVTRCTTLEKSSELLREGATEVLFSPDDSQTLNEALQRDVSLGDTTLLQPGLFDHTKLSIVTMCLKTSDALANKVPLCLVPELEACGRINQKTGRQLELAFQEALTNALDHGNLELDSRWRELIDAAGKDKYSAVKKQRLSDPYYANRKLVISFEYRDDILTIRVRDEGPGFSPPPSEVRQQKIANLKCSGRGLAIIFRSVDEVTYLRDGREICMRKRVSCRASHGKGA